MSEDRVPIPPAAAAELKARYQARAEAEQRLSDYLLAVAHMAAVDPASVRGFNDETGELLIADD